MKPLHNIKVLDLTRVLAGPFCTMILSDLGAEVIKVEIPDTGDDSRAFGPFLNNQSLYFVSINRGKKSISINLKSEKGKQIIRDLITKVDVVIENFRPGTMEKLGLGYDRLKEINPKIIYAAASGFGHSGPYSLKPAYDILAQAMGGVMSFTGWPNTPPTRVGISMGDLTASLYTAIGINAALYHREKTGEGQKIDVAMLDCQIAMLENALARYQVDKVSPKPMGNRHPGITPFQAFKAKDKYFVLAIGNDSLWVSLCKAINHEELLTIERFKTNKQRNENYNEVVEILAKLFETKTADEWLKIIGDAQIPCAPINEIEDVMNDEQVKSRNMIIDVEDKNIGTVKIAGNPIKMTSIPEELHKTPAPEIGEHNVEILQKYLNYTPEFIENLKKEGVI